MSTTEADDNQQQQPQQQTWTTWDELLLAFAVKRHGCRNWDSVATELQTRTKLIHTSPEACRRKFHDIRRRFHSSAADADGEIDDEDDDVDLTVPWVEDLRRLRLDELRAEVNRHDLSIKSLQSKVKRLEKDREQSVKDEGEEVKPSDLERSDNNQPDAEPSPSQSNPRAAADDDNDNDESDPENQSVNGSNSTGPNKAKERGSGQKETEPETQTGLEGEIEPVQPVSKRSESVSTSQGESSDSIDKGLSIETKKKGGGAKTDSDVQSSATLSRKRQRKKESPGASGEADGSLRTEESGPLIDVLSFVRAHKDASFLERRLLVQESKMYDNIVRQHMDLQTIQNNLDSGSYASSHLSFFRDLILTFTNTIIFYPKTSLEYKAALELRSTVLEKMEEHFKQSQRSEEKLSSAPPSPGSKPLLERSDSLLAKHKSSGSGPIVVCRKRSSISAKGNSNSKGEQPQSDVGDETKTVALADLKPSPMEERGLLSSKTKDRVVTGTRSIRRSTSLKKPVTLPNTPTAAATYNNNKKETLITTTAAAEMTTTTEKKKEESSASKKDDNSAKKKGAADFLKRLKGNSPVKSKDVKSSTAKGNSSTAGGEQKKKNRNGDKVDRRRKIARQTDLGKQTSKNEGGSSPTKRNVGRPSKKTPESATTAVKRARESEASASKQPKKRTRR